MGGFDGQRRGRPHEDFLHLLDGNEAVSAGGMRQEKVSIPKVPLVDGKQPAGGRTHLVPGTAALGFHFQPSMKPAAPSQLAADAAVAACADTAQTHGAHIPGPEDNQKLPSQFPPKKSQTVFTITQ
jgi:hypothetical protein